VVFVVVVIIGSIYGAIAARKRREGLLELAARLNLDFDTGEDGNIPARFEFLKQLDQGDNRYATNVISGTYQQYDVLAFDYHLPNLLPTTKTGGTPSTTGFHFSSSRCP
jgi:hypothetical protein